MNEKVIADTMWAIRKMRVEGKSLTDNSVWDEQRFLFFHTEQEIAHALREIERRGFHWNRTYADIPDTCIVVG